MVGGPSRSRPPAGTHSARSQPRSTPSTSTGVGAPVTATQTPASEVSSSPPQVTSSSASSGPLPTSRLASVGGRPVQRTGPGYAEVREPGPAAVLDGGQRTGALDGRIMRGRT